MCFAAETNVQKFREVINIADFDRNVQSWREELTQGMKNMNEKYPESQYAIQKVAFAFILNASNYGHK